MQQGIAADGPNSEPWIRSHSTPHSTSIAVRLYLLLVTTALDYKFPVQTTGTIIYQLVLFLFGLTLSASIFFSLKRYVESRRVFIFSALVGFFLVFSCIVGALRGLDIAVMARYSITFLIFIEGVIVGGSILDAKIPISRIFNVLLFGALTAMIVRFGIVAATTGINYATVRYQILSGAVPFLTGYGVYVLLHGRLTILNSVCLLLHLVIVTISVTRTALAVAVGVAVMGVVPSLRRAFSAGFFARLALLPVVGAILLFVLGPLLPGSPFERWGGRLIGERETFGFDITALTRAGQVEFQIQETLSAPDKLIFGNGLTAVSFYSSRVIRLLYERIGLDPQEYDVGIGHNAYVGIIYVGGLLGGVPMLAALAILYFLSVRMLVAGRFSDSVQPQASEWALLAAAYACLAYGISAYFGGVFSDRQQCMFLGVAAGLVLAGHKRLFDLVDDARARS